jgi:hypothetical protein
LRAETKPATELSEQVSQRPCRILVLRHHAAQHQRRFEQRERIGWIGVCRNIADRGGLQHGLDVSAIQYQSRLRQGLRLGEDRVTSAQRDRSVEHRAAALDTVGRRIGPPTTEIDAGCGMDADRLTVDGRGSKGRTCNLQLGTFHHLR